MAFQASELSIELVEALAPLMSRIKQRDKSLADQLARSTAQRLSSLIMQRWDYRGLSD